MCFFVFLECLVFRCRRNSKMNHEETLDALRAQLDAYRKRSVKLASELDAERNEKRQLQALCSQLRTSAEHSNSVHANVNAVGSCSSCSPASQQFCVHKSALASHIIDLTFDGHKDVLRQKLRAATEELEKLRRGVGSGGSDVVVEELTRQVSTLEAANNAQKREIDTLRRELCDAKINALKARTSVAVDLSTAPTTTTMSAQHERVRQLEERAEQALLLQLAMRALFQVEQLGATREDWLIAHANAAMSATAAAAAHHDASYSLPRHAPLGTEQGDPVERHIVPTSLQSSSSLSSAVPVPLVHRGQTHQQLRSAAGDSVQGLTPRESVEEVQVTNNTANTSTARKRTSTLQPRPLRGLL
ncbi:Hypothetical protein, putative [Bodo saltans]|uniref:Uncharacterized protein n=1 Tax=Bodo saltans TaxID=75058 RepID=A0A0S4IIZ4_BODSA|nr:Hypothetical protein, putative [Bodo saltans]|eukprot:CUE73814.1 Hypothetical protein, putative [Bodo saltans]